MGNVNSIPGNKSSGTGMIIGGILGILFAGLIIFVTIYNNKATNQLINSPEPPLPQDVPQDVPVLNENVMGGSDEYLVQLTMKPNISIDFEGRSSIKRLWDGKNPKFQIVAPYSQIINATTHSEIWGDLLTSNQPGERDFTPYLATTLPVDTDYYHKWVTAKASLDITYPTNSGGLGFTNKSEHLKRTIRFFIISEEENKLLLAHNSWREAKNNSGFWNNIAPMLCPLILSLFLGIFFLVFGISEKRG